MRPILHTILWFAVLFTATPSLGASLQVSPVVLDVVAEGASATSLTLHNSGTKPIEAQVRVFRWSQAGGSDTLTETRDVVVSPPMMGLRPGADYTVRVVRVSKAAVTGEESYRLLVDELPDLQNQAPGTVALLIRQSLPVFFRSPDASAPSLVWTVIRTGRRLSVRVANGGDRHARISRLKVRAGALVSFGDGLVGYALGHSAAVWTARGATKGVSGTKASITAQSDTGPINATAVVTTSR
jgi:fimbrial chaperone protein